MATPIPLLSPVDAITAGDMIPMHSSANGDTRRASPAVLLSYMQDNLTIGGFGAYATQYSAPSATGFSVTVTDGADDNTNVHLILTPGGTYAAGTMVLPAIADVVDKQEVLVNCTQIVTTLTIDKNGATALTGAPTTIAAANGFFR